MYKSLGMATLTLVWVRHMGRLRFRCESFRLEAFQDSELAVWGVEI